VAAGLAGMGHDVTGLDISEELVRELTAGQVRILEPGLAPLVRRGLDADNLRFTTDYPGAVTGAEFVFLAVDTPQTLAGAADMRNLRAASRQIASLLDGSNPIIVNKSTSPIGTGETIEAIIGAFLEADQPAPRIVSNPEFLQQGRAVENFFRPDRIVVGARDPRDAHAVADLYAGLSSDVMVTDLRTSEMVKYVANAFLATRVSFINEIARLCEQIGVNVDRVVDGVALDERIGRHFFRAGIGYGGSCLPKDVAALRYIGQIHGVSTPVLSGVQEINNTQKAEAVSRLRRRLGTLDGRVIGVLGLTFKGATEDIRESPAMDVVALLRNEGATVQVFDPAVKPDRPDLPSGLRGTITGSAVEAAAGADALAILTDWAEFRDLPLAAVRAVMNGNVVFDGRNMLDMRAVEAEGFAYLGIGRIATKQRRRRSDA
jgi:UDPglucose 6-dehydrogenase